jgi:hypothetical protein
VGATISNTSEAWEWFDANLTAAGPGAVQDVIRRLNSKDPDPVNAIDWFDQRAERLNEKQAQSAYAAIGTVWATKPTEEVVTWATSNPDHPQRDAMLQPSVAAALRRRDIPTARQLIGMLQDGKTRAMLSETLATMETLEAAATQR